MRALYLVEKCFSLLVTTFYSSEIGNLVLYFVVAIRRSMGMRIAGRTFLRFSLRNIDVVGGGELQSIPAVRHFVVVQAEFLFGIHPGAISEHRRCAMIDMIVNGPLRKNGVWILGVEGLFQ